MEIIKGTLRLETQKHSDLGIQCVWPIRVRLGQVSPCFLSLSLPCRVVCAGTAPGNGVQREPPTLLLHLTASGNLGRSVVTRAPAYFWQVWDLCLLRWVVLLLQSQAPKRSGHPSCLSLMQFASLVPVLSSRSWGSFIPCPWLFLESTSCAGGNARMGGINTPCRAGSWLLTASGWHWMWRDYGAGRSGFPLGVSTPYGRPLRCWCV